MSHSKSLGPEPGDYKITAVGSGLVVSLEKGFPRGNLVVEEPNQSILYQKWALICQADNIYTFKSRIEQFENKGIDDSKKPYARNNEDDFIDPYIRGGALDVFTTYRIRPQKPGVFTISLPERLTTVWTIIDGGTNIILEKYDEILGPNSNQLWRFEQTGDS